MPFEDSLVAPAKPSPLKPALVVAGLLGLAGAAWWALGRGTGQPEDPARVLIIGPTPALAEYLEQRGFDVAQLSFGAAVGEGQALDPSLEELGAIVAYADHDGFGYVALNLAHGQRYELAAAGYPAEEPPPGTTFAALSVGDLGRRVSFGGVPLGVAHAHPVDEQVGLLLALFGQPEIAKAKHRQASNDLMIRFGSARTVATVTDLEQAQEQMRRQIDGWTGLAARERGPVEPLELARPYERLRGWPLANGAVLVASQPLLRSPDGLRTELDPAVDGTAELHVVSLASPDQRQPCTSLPDALDVDSLAVAATGDALLVPVNAAIAQLWTLTDDGCGFEPGDEIRRLFAGTLGQPHASGRTAASQGGRLSWAEAKQRRARELALGGVELRPDALRWVSPEVVVIPAQLSFAVAAAARDQAAVMAELAAGEQATPPARPPVDPTTLPSDRQALVFVRLPRATTANPEPPVAVAVVPLDLLVTGDPSLANLRSVTPLRADGDDDPRAELRVAVYLDDGDAQLIDLRLPAAGPVWHEHDPIGFDLAVAAASASAHIQVRPLAAQIPAEAEDLVVAPTGRRAAWSAPVGPAPQDAADSTDFEVFVLELDRADAQPRRLTDNDRADLGAVFVGPDAAALLFTSGYPTDAELGVIASVRALVL